MSTDCVHDRPQTVPSPSRSRLGFGPTRLTGATLSDCNSFIFFGVATQSFDTERKGPFAGRNHLFSSVGWPEYADRRTIATTHRLRTSVCAAVMERSDCR